MQSEHIDIAETLIRKATKRLAEAYSTFWEASAPGLDERTQLNLRLQEAESCIEALLLFQSGMEAIINEEINTNKKLAGVRKERVFLQRKVKDLSFKNKWLNTFKALELEDSQKYLENYLDFYRDFRVPITHPSNRYFDISHYRFTNIYEGFRNGWMAFMTLATGWEDTAKTQSWKQYCEENGLPDEVEI